MSSRAELATVALWTVCSRLQVDLHVVNWSTGQLVKRPVKWHVTVCGHSWLPSTSTSPLI